MGYYLFPANLAGTVQLAPGSARVSIALSGVPCSHGTVHFGKDQWFGFVAGTAPKARGTRALPIPLNRSGLVLKSMPACLRFSLVLFAAMLIAGSVVRAADNDWLYLDNGQIRLGVKTNSGACIGYFAESRTGRNLLNHYDQGRFIQQSWYGAEDGSDWNGKPWRWNPVQGGDWKGHPAKTLELRHTKTNLHAKTLPKHWASGADITNVVMEQWITLNGPVAHVKFKFAYTGAKSHPAHHQEMPAVYVDCAFTNLVYYRGDKPWSGGALTRRVPGWPNEYDRNTENWAAYMDDKDWGMGVYVPGVSDMTFFLARGKAGPKGDGCSYVAPIRTLAITNGFVNEYDVYLTIGPIEGMRTLFSALRASMAGRRTGP